MVSGCVRLPLDKESPAMRVVCWIDQHSDYNNGSRWLAGLHMLGVQGKITLKFKVPKRSLVS